MITKNMVEKMKKIIIYTYLAVLCLCANVVVAQGDYTSVLKDIEANNIELKALRADMEAQQIENSAANTLENPSIDGSYSWCNVAQMGPKKTLSVAQPFDFPTVYVQRGKLIGVENDNLQYHYRSQRISILLEAKKLCIDITYYNALVDIYAQRLQNAQAIAANYHKKMEAGDANILEVNKAELNLTSVQSDYDKAVSERQALLTSLAQMNGGVSIVVVESKFEYAVLPASFDEWYKQMESQNPVLQHAEGLVQADKQRLKVVQNQWLPQLNIGYVNETVGEESFRGVALGLSLPLWNNGKNVKQSKAKVAAAELELSNVRNNTYNAFKVLFQQSATLIQNADRLNATLTRCSSEALLQKALEAGEISLLEYLLEIEFFQDATINALAAQRDAQMALAELFAINL